MTWNKWTTSVNSWVFLSPPGLLWEGAAVVQVTLGTTLKTVLVCCLRKCWLSLLSVVARLWVDGSCFTHWNDRSKAEWQLYTDLASKQRRRTDPRSGPLCPGSRAWLSCGWQHAGTVFFLHPELPWAKERKLFTGNSCVWLAFSASTLQERFGNNSATVYHDVFRFMCTCRWHSLHVYFLSLREHFFGAVY